MQILSFVYVHSKYFSYMIKSTYLKHFFEGSGDSGFSSISFVSLFADKWT